MVDSAMKVLLGIPTGEMGRRADFYDYLHRLEKPPGSFMLLSHARSPARSRNDIIQAALDNSCTHILFIDDDMAFEADALSRLLRHNVDIVSGLYLSRAYPHQPFIFDSINKDNYALFSYLDGPLPDLKEIEAAGFGFLLVKTSIFEKLEKPYVRLGELDSQEWCDDIGFFVRAKAAGIKSYCDTTCKVGHIGTMIVWPHFDEKKEEWFTNYETGGKGQIATPQILPQPEVEPVS